MNRRMLLALAGMSLAGRAFAQTTGTPARLRGKIDAVSGDWFSLIVSREGQPQLISNAVFVNH